MSKHAFQPGFSSSESVVEVQAYRSRLIAMPSTLATVLCVLCLLILRRMHAQQSQVPLVDWISGCAAQHNLARLHTVSDAILL